MPFDFKKEYKDLYQPKALPSIVTVPAAGFLAVDGEGDPNEEGGAYQQAVSQLYAVAYALKMSDRAGYVMEGFFPYVVPPLEGFWRQGEMDGTEDYSRKADFRWTSVLRLPDFVTAADVAWAVETAEKKKKLDCSAVKLRTIDEGLCVQMLHLGPYDSEPQTIAAMEAFAAERGFLPDCSAERLHHEIYLSDPRKSPPEKWRTVIRHPIRNA